MGLVRILVDGYSLLHSWPELAPRFPRHSAGARDELIRVLARYHDAIHTPVTVVFDGAGAPPGTPKHSSPHGLEVLYSKAGRTADDIIERAAFRLLRHGDVLVVTNDLAERDTVLSFGAMTSDCESFILSIEAELGELERRVAAHNRRERAKFRQAP